MGQWRWVRKPCSEQICGAAPHTLDATDIGYPGAETIRAFGDRNFTTPSKILPGRAHVSTGHWNIDMDAIPVGCTVILSCENEITADRLLFLSGSGCTEAPL